MKQFLLLALCICTMQSSATNVSGTISSNTNWIKANNPYIVNGNLTVDSAITLTIEPGVIVRVDSNMSFVVHGRIKAEGTDLDTIKFTTNSTTPNKNAWQGLTLNSKVMFDSNVVKYCRFEHSATAIANWSYYLQINNSVFANNKIGLLNIKGRPNIKQSLVTNNDTGVYNTEVGNSIEYCVFTFNNVGYFDTSNRGFRIKDNEFNYNKIGACYIGDEKTNFPAENTFKGNVQYGVYVNYREPGKMYSIRANLMIYNGTAVYVNNVVGGYIYTNTIAYNNIGVDYNMTYPGNTTQPGMPLKLWVNCFINNYQYSFVNNSAKDYVTDKNYWGTKTAAGIDSTIYDINDNSSKGKVTYTPYDTLDSYCQAVAPPELCLQPTSITLTPTTSSTAVVTWPSVPDAVAYEYYVVSTLTTQPSTGIITQDTSVIVTSLDPEYTYIACVRTVCQNVPFNSAWVCDTATMPQETGIATLNDDKQISVYPNPATSELTITGKNMQTVLIKNISGATVYQHAVNANSATINTSQWASGIYIATIEHDDGTVVHKKIIKE